MSTVYKGIKVPDLTDQPNAPQQFRDLVDTGGAVPRFATLAEANTAYPAGQRPAGLMVAVGTRLYISDGTNFVSISAGGIEAFADRAARAAALPSPAIGQTTSLATWPGYLHTWDGTRWMVTQSGRFEGATDPNSLVVFSYPRAFQAVPVSFHAQGDGSTNYNVLISPLAGQIYADRVNLVVRVAGPTAIAPVPSTGVGFWWQARGAS